MNRSQSYPTRASRPDSLIAAGLTLIELMIALALVAILLASAAPNWRAFLATSELRDRSESLMRALSLVAMRTSSRRLPMAAPRTSSAMPLE